jgi:1,4-alpha-glucan branching enzyme
MLKKNYSKTKQFCRVTFRHDPEQEAERVQVLGEFNGWGKEGHELKKRKDGTFSLTLSLEANKEYKFRYLIDNKHWLNDETADDLVRNPFGQQDALLRI